MHPLTFSAISLFLASIYCFWLLFHLMNVKTSKWIFTSVYWVTILFAFFSLYRVWDIAQSSSIFRGTDVNFYLASFLTLYAFFLALSFFFLLQDLPRLFIGIVNFAKSLFTSTETTAFIPKRRDALTKLAIGLASLPFAAMLYGVTKGKYKYTVNKISLKLKNLPSSFEGYKLVQISDIHAGSFDSKEQVLKGVDMINDLKADAVFFTGDLVNSSKEEIEPYIDVFQKIESKDGKYAVLGNHDYYGLYDLDESEKEAYWLDFYEKYKRMGFDLINNSNRTIQRAGEVLKIIGVENWGAGRWFPKEGDLDLALEGVGQSDCCVLLSHDPTHWEEKVLDHSKFIDLTLSGHTHGFQFGINMPGFKWSPAQYRYNRWMGHYIEKDQHLYINRGFGFLAFPGRVGMWPEITLIELQTA